MRKLASIQQVTNIRPIEGKDRIVQCNVLGWNLIIKKDEFAEGDKCVYCEIDSILPEKPEFEFLRRNKFRIRTMKLSGVRSEGICFPLTMLPAREKPYEIGEDVTELMGITKWEPQEDEEWWKGLKESPRKKTFWEKLPLMRFRWYRQLFGQTKKAKRGWPEQIPVTDEVRCLDGDTKVLTDTGIIRIGDIVNKRLNVKVASVDNSGQLVWRNIVDYQKYPADQQMVKIRFPFRPYCGRLNSIECTMDHKLLTADGYKRADELTVEDKLVYIKRTCDDDLIPIIYGMLLGDGHMQIDRRTTLMSEKAQSVRISLCQGEKQKEYLNYKLRLCGELAGPAREAKSGFCNSKVYQASLAQDYYITDCLHRDGCIAEDMSLRVTKEFCSRLTAASLAIWYMDDGTCKYLNNEHYHYNRYGNTSPCVDIATNSFDLDEVQLLSDTLLHRFGVKNDIRFDNKADGRSYPYIKIPTDGTKEFMKIIAPYIPQCMQFKLTDDLRGTKCLLDDFVPHMRDRVIYDRIDSIERFTLSKFSNHRYVYDLEVEDTHNFIANGIVNHNCQNCPEILKDKETKWLLSEKIDGTSASYLLLRHRHKLRPDTFEFIVCSRKLRLARDNSHYWQVADKYQIEKVLRGLIKDDDWIAVQGEIVGPKIQKNKYKFTDYRFFVFNLLQPNIGTSSYRRSDSVSASFMLRNAGLEFVPIVDVGITLPDTVDEVLAMAHGHSRLGDTLREGIVFRSSDGTKSFKAVDPEFLIHYGI